MVDANSRHGRHLCQIQGGVWPTADVQNYEESVTFKEMYGLQQMQDSGESVRSNGMCGLPQISRILKSASDSRGCMAYHICAGF